jgi:hypothetical protein
VFLEIVLFKEKKNLSSQIFCLSCELARPVLIASLDRQSFGLAELRQLEPDHPRTIDHQLLALS